MNNQQQAKQQIWLTDQVTKGEFFRQKLHEYGLLDIAIAIESVQGEKLSWDLEQLNISTNAWNKIIHRGIMPVRIFAHPWVLMNIPRSAGYYRGLAMVSLKSMSNIQLSMEKFEKGENNTPMPEDKALAIAQRLNTLISLLIEAEPAIGPRIFDLWRGMTAGSTAQGSWQNKKGDIVEELIKAFIQRRIQEQHLLNNISEDQTTLTLRDNRTVVYKSEPDIGIYNQTNHILAAIEIKGGIDPAGVLERIGAAIKSLSRAKQENSNATTILIIYGVSMSPQAKQDLIAHKNDIDIWFTIEDILNQSSKRQALFDYLKI